MISIHAPREGGDCPETEYTCRSENFNPRPPRGGRRYYQGYKRQRTTFQSTPPARGATLVKMAQEVLENISIHAPREGGDGMHL